MLQVTLEKIQEAVDPEIRNVLLKLFALYALFSLDKYHLGTVYQGGILNGTDLTTLLQESILRLCSELKNDAVSLVDVLAPPDFVLNSVLGASDGQVSFTTNFHPQLIVDNHFRFIKIYKLQCSVLRML